MNIRTEILRIMEEESSPSILLGKVESVDGYLCNVMPLDDDAELMDVRLRNVIDGSDTGIVCIPKVGAVALVLILGNDDTTAVALSFTEVERTEVRMNGFELIIDDSGNMVMNGGDNEGIPKLPVLQGESDKVARFLDAIRRSFESFTPVPNDGGAALKAVMLSTISSLPLPDLSQAGNEKIKH